MLGEGAMMTSRIGRSVGVLLGFGLICCACSGGSTGGTLKANPGTNHGGSAGSDSTICSPGTRRCDGHEIKRCDDTGSHEIIEQDCSSAECRMQGNAPSCAPTVCSASLPVCDGSIATKCKSDGSGPLPGGVDCTANDQFCRAGKCHDTLCDPDQKSCKDGDVYLCSTDGSSLTVWDWCTDSELCDEDSAACVAQVCEAGAVSCDGTRVVTCDALGSSWLAATTDCAVQGKVCIAGSCEKRTCAASTTFCEGNDLYQCDPTGASSTLSRTCVPGVEHCEVTPAGLYAYCVANACEAGKKLCAGNVIKTCNADGSLPAVGTTCSKDEYCEDAECKPRSCELGALFCKDNDVYSCQDSGPELYTSCESGQACVALAAGLDPNIDASFYYDLVVCVPQACTPGTTSCALNEVGTCGPDGATLSSISNDCAASGKVCTADASCAASASDTLGKDEFAQGMSAGVFLGDVVAVRSPRKLTEIAMWLVFPAARDLRWAVYEQVGNDFISRVEKTSTVANGTGFVGSGPLSYQLEAGKRYAFGVEVSGESVGFSDSLPFAKDPSFGTLLGGLNAYTPTSSFSIAGSFVPYNAVYMKVTTESP